MKCPVCGSTHNSVYSSLTDNYDGEDKGAAIRRRRKCSDCGTRWTTYEVIMTTSEYHKTKTRRKKTKQKEVEDNDI